MPGLRVASIGSSSVRYEIGLFWRRLAEFAAAMRHFVHVYVDRATRRPSRLPKLKTTPGKDFVSFHLPPRRPPRSDRTRR